MKKLAEIFTRLLGRLANIPGLRFIQDYMVEARGAGVAFGQRKGDYVAYMRHGQGALDDVGEMAGRKKGGRVEEDDDFDDDDYAVDEIDDLEYDSDESSTYDGYSGTRDHDYPPSDEYNAYYNDDYKSY